MNEYADLHIHTNFSDGTFSPEKIVEEAKHKNLKAISITDHDSCGGVAQAIKKGEALGIEVIPGIELSSEQDNKDIHILGYFIDYKDKKFLDKLEVFIKRRETRAKEILEKLKVFDIEIEYKELLELTNNDRVSIGRLHIAHLLLKNNYVSSINQAFKKYIGDNAPCYVKKFKLTPKEAIDLIKEAKGIAILAHPKSLKFDNISKEETINIFIEAGIQGLEVYHTDHNKDDEKMFKDIVKKHGLLVTGGSDCHGLAKKNVLLGTKKIPYSLVEQLKEQYNNLAI